MSSGARPGRLLTPRLDHRGYPKVNLSAANRPHSIYAHKVVGLTFLGPRPAGGWEINHKDGDKQHACATNLEYVGPGQNQAHALAIGLYKRGEEQSNSRLTDEAVREIRLLRDRVSQRELARRFHVSQVIIGRVQRRERWGHLQ